MSNCIQCLQRNINPNISRYKDSDLEICVALQTQALSFAITERQNRIPMAIGRYRFSFEEKGYLECIEETQKTEALLDPSFQYAKRTVTVEEFKSTLIPEKLYQAQDAKAYLSALYHLNGKECITQENDPHSRSYILTAFNPVFLKAAQILFSQENGLNFHSVYACLVRESFRLSRQYKRFSHHIVLNLRRKEFDLCIKNDDGLLFLNTFPCPDSDNLLYYLLYAINSLKIDTGSAALYLCGESSEKRLMPLLEPQFFALTYLPGPAQVRFPKEMPYDRYFECF